MSTDNEDLCLAIFETKRNWGLIKRDEQDLYSYI